MTCEVERNRSFKVFQLFRERERQAIEPLNVQAEKRDIPDETHVYIVKPSFDPRLKWTVLYKGNKTEVSMRDKGFQGEVERGKPFAKGDILAVRLVIHQKLDPALNTYVNKSYDIVEVGAHIPRSEQPKLWDGPSITKLPPSRIALPPSSEDQEE